MSKVEKYLDLCETALEDLEKGEEAGQSLRTLYNRLYYACFYSAEAALRSKDIQTGSHAGTADRVFTVLHDEEKVVDRETAAVINKVQSKRDKSNYELEMKEDMEDYKMIKEEAKKFIEEMKKVVQSNE